MSGGRPSDYSEALADSICAQMSEGMSLRTICLAEDMPDKRTVFRWIARHEEFRHQYAKAQEDRAAAIAEDMFDIADEGNPDDVQRAKLRIDTRKWLLSKMAPKKYGERTTSVLEGGDKPIDMRDVTDIDRAKAMALLATKAKRAGAQK